MINPGSSRGSCRHGAAEVKALHEVPAALFAVAPMPQRRGAVEGEGRPGIRPRTIHMAVHAVVSRQ